MSFLALVAQRLKAERFALLDIGCSGGLDPKWRAFGDRLKALGIDASASECQRLTAEERNPDVSYVAAFVSPSADKAVDLSAGPAAPLIMKMRDRMSFMRTREIRDARLQTASAEEQLRHNAWELTGLADPNKPVVVPDLLSERGWTDLDYMKIDTDGIDWQILQSFEGRLPQDLLAVQMEVNFVGDGSPDEHSFHNTDRFMRRHGFDLFRLDVRNYSSRALPARYIWPTPAETHSGRPFQGEAYYGLDLLGPNGATKLTDLSAEKIAKLAAILSAWDVPDAAAELLVGCRDRLKPVIDVDRGLDRLAAQAQGDRARPLDYRSYMARFETDPPDFYRPEGPIPLRERLAAAWHAYMRPRDRR
ncbi:FkbM family methyltransferase [Reyranella sp. MMS21-HV4-11]|uniref:FkbM family methyltransferase n=1 Tax=Reyranella humidisoli TaxID=2849149 RepID=A0ABS6IMQ9_9HYPH|nr:FkbM family methyltransferase [Reyranella sp. MMS21-HV4-11]MBU8875578.1 FkbM family methyltransferase [Reyranella sp. MMS21-HV4-11]